MRHLLFSWEGLRPVS